MRQIECSLNKNTTFYIKEYWGIIVVTFFMFVAFIYICCNGENVYIQPHDNLDGFVGYEKFVDDSGMYFAHSEKVRVLGGLDRNYFFSELKLISFIYWIFPTFIAYVVVYYLKAIMSIIGFALLFKHPLINLEKYLNVAILMGLVYGINPCYPGASFGFASIPLLLVILLNIYQKPKLRWFSLLVFYPVLSDFNFFGIFICGYLLLFAIIDTIRRKRICWSITFALIVVSIGFVISDYRMFMSMLTSYVPTVREDFPKSYGISNIYDIVVTTINIFFYGQY